MAETHVRPHHSQCSRRAPEAGWCAQKNGRPQHATSHKNSKVPQASDSETAQQNKGSCSICSGGDVRKSHATRRITRRRLWGQLPPGPSGEGSEERWRKSARRVVQQVTGNDPRLRIARCNLCDTGFDTPLMQAVLSQAILFEERSRARHNRDSSLGLNETKNGECK